MKFNPLPLLKPANLSRLLSACRSSALPAPEAKLSLERNLEATYAWLCLAHDATPDGGVAGWYSLLKGWSASYPEVTGYIIPTFLTYAEAMSAPEAKKRALRMALWEIDVQLPEGAVRSGVMTTKAAPAVFNTGQVLFGWASAYQATRDQRFAAAAQRAAKWLVQQQDTDGAWRKNLSLLTTSKVQTYNVRAAWGLALAGHVFDEKKWIDAAARNCNWALEQQKPNGWFENNSFYENEVPLLHTIAYTLEGLLGVGELLGQQKYVLSARSGVEPLMGIINESGGLKGRYDSAWRSPVSWRCPTGEAQTALVLLRLARHFPAEKALSETARAILRSLARIQAINSRYPELNGPLGGSQPLWGGYCPFSYISWAAKFYLDALLLALKAEDVASLE